MRFVAQLFQTVTWVIMALTSSIIKCASKWIPLGLIMRSCSSSTSTTVNLATIRRELEKFDGGSVDLEMDEESGIAVMTLNNPRRMNSMTGKMMVDMADMLTDLEKWSAGKGVILMGAGGNFCSGGDLNFVRKALHYGAEMATFQHHTLTRLHNLPLVSVALLQGHTLGGGAELSTACDFRVMSAGGKVGFVQIKMGLTPGWGATTRLVQLLGRQRALRLLCSARIMSAEEAETEGLVDRVLSYATPADQELPEVRQWLAASYCKHHPELTQAMKSSVVFSHLNWDLESSLRNERDVFAKYWGGPVQKAALQANIKHKK